VEEAERELDGNTQDILVARKVMKIGGEELRDGEGIHKMHMANAFTRMLAYRVLDITQWIKNGGKADHMVQATHINGPKSKFLHTLVSS
jgi:hypothetical protein